MTLKELDMWVLILVFFAVNTVTIVDSQQVEMESKEICLEAKRLIENDYDNYSEISVKATCVKTRKIRRF